ncbi:hypothetical protein ACQPYK_11155 [Streptosporangium sp. CA-135522]|uniref:hypothetical protein n=1 Tax=Streptosporangium sp. CA-135522 TaxID=3240072 RepID=UPI003D8FE1DC
MIDGGSATSVPFIHAADADGDGGRGLFLVEMMAAGWGAHHDEAGNAVWFHVADSARWHLRAHRRSFLWCPALRSFRKRRFSYGDAP